MTGISADRVCPPHMTHRLRFLFFLALAPFLLLPVVVMIRNQSGFAWFNSSSQRWAMWGIFVAYLFTRPSNKEPITIFCLAALLNLIHGHFFSEIWYAGHQIIGIGAYLPFFVIPLLVYRSIRQPQYRLLVYMLFFFTYVAICVGFYLQFWTHISPYRYDHLVYAFDTALGPHINFLLGQLSDSVPLVRTTLNATYQSVGFVMAVVTSAYLSRRNNQVNVLKLNVLNALIGFGLYAACPAMGPKYSFSTFPCLPAQVIPLPVIADGVPNCVPSLHIACAVFCYLLARSWKALRVITGLYLALTACAVLSTGEHYEADLIVTIPYALLIFALSSNRPGRGRLAVPCVVYLAFWLAVLRYGQANRFIAWAMLVTCLAACYRIERRLLGSIPTLQLTADPGKKLAVSYRKAVFLIGVSLSPSVADSLQLSGQNDTRTPS